jgi:hypothetical protein
MDQEVLVNAFRRTAEEFEKLYGPVALLLLIAPDEEAIDSWNVLISAHVLDSLALGQAVSRVSDTLRKTLKKSLWPVIARTTVLRTNDPFVQAFTRRYTNLEAGSMLQAVSVSGVDIPKVVVFEAKRRAA